jgi:putative transcriptional regulator
MEKIPYAQLDKGTILIASPDIDSGIYFRSVIIICEHGQAGSFGIMINKPIDIEIPEDVLNTTEIVNPRVKIRMGGTLYPSQMMLLHDSPQIQENALQLCTSPLYIGGDIEFLKVAMTDCNGPNIFLCFGHCAWEPGQLEKEFLSGLWFPSPSSTIQIFNTEPNLLWRKALYALGGKYASLSTIPEDLSVN